MQFCRVTFVMLWHISERTGGAEVQASYLAEELVKRGYEVQYICQTITKTNINTNSVVNGVKIHWIKPSRKFSWTNYLNYRNKLKITKPDIIIQRNSSPVLFGSYLYKKKTNAKLIWICTDNLSPLRDFYKKRFITKNTIRSTGLFKYIVYYLNCLLEDKLRNHGMKGVDLGFSQNNYQKIEILKNFGIDTHQMISGHYPIEDSIINKVKHRFSSKIILWCANFGKHKRPELFLKLAELMQHTDCNFIMIGNHADKNHLKNLLINKPKNLTLTGHLSFEEALHYFNKASLFINTSSPSGDGFPNTFIQSWLRGVPVLTFGFDPDNIVEEHQLGLIVKHEIEARAEITYLFSNNDVYSKMSQNVYTYALNNHTVEKMTNHFLNTIKAQT
ncbi:glycosyltransferase family 4 protein [Ichthyenterobacterium sp. W332]|uniref:Glycosyltransferase family 4 protein n=1 Tax=Microcosmobacter mediterraneus TaxID=3075607 RepID=A0ABU2YMJ8_9FLAO|nr:glycosyltransferase family 4 protein [Ichthyenterobacterium sp. W332]MDT0559386.1 glycosyltransferase family 4 protein [Ichthyenterobacterium sp. W332]